MGWMVKFSIKLKSDSKSLHPKKQFRAKFDDNLEKFDKK